MTITKIGEGVSSCVFRDLQQCEGSSSPRDKDIVYKVYFNAEQYNVEKTMYDSLKSLDPDHKFTVRCYGGCEITKDMPEVLKKCPKGNNIQGVWQLQLEYYGMSSLQTYLNTHEKSVLEEIKDVLREKYIQLLGFIKKLHENNKYHGDINTGNILVGRDLSMKIIDFTPSPLLGFDHYKQSDVGRAYSIFLDLDFEFYNACHSNTFTSIEEIIKAWEAYNGDKQCPSVAKKRRKNGGKKRSKSTPRRL